MGESSSDDESSGPGLPRGVLKGRGGWQGEALELEHQRAILREEAADDYGGDGADPTASKKKKAAVAVDLDQFRNTEVGKGYQAKHVIRQKSAKHEEVKVRDMSKQPEKKKKRKCGDDDKASPPAVSGEDTNTGLDKTLLKYLQCEGMRIFRKELDKIESSS